MRRTMGSQVDAEAIRSPTEARWRAAEAARIASGRRSRKPGLPASLPRAFAALHARLGAFGDQSPLELGDGAEHLERKHALRRRGVDRIAQRTEMRVARFEILDHREEVADRTGETIEADDHQDVAGVDFVQKLGQHRPSARGAGAVLLMDGLAAGRPELVDLRVGRLLLGRDAGVADQPADQMGEQSVGGSQFLRLPLIEIKQFSCSTISRLIYNS